MSEEKVKAGKKPKSAKPHSARPEKLGGVEVVPAEKLPRGRPTILSQEKQKTICDLVALGNNIEDAVILAEVSKQTFYNWVHRGQLELDRLERNPDTEINPDEAIYADFVDSLQRAKRQAKSRNIAAIQKAVNNGSFRAAQWWLERRYPHEFGKIQRVEYTNTSNNIIDVTEAVQELERIFKALDEKDERDT